MSVMQISGRQAIVQDVSFLGLYFFLKETLKIIPQLIHRVEKDETVFEFEKTTDVFCIGSLLKVGPNTQPSLQNKLLTQTNSDTCENSQSHFSSSLSQKDSNIPQAVVRFIPAHQPFIYTD